jgi:hypothetical protein
MRSKAFDAALTLIRRIKLFLATLDERHFRAVHPGHVDSLRLFPTDLD